MSDNTSPPCKYVLHTSADGVMKFVCMREVVAGTDYCHWHLGMTEAGHRIANSYVRGLVTDLVTELRKLPASRKAELVSQLQKVLRQVA